MRLSEIQREAHCRLQGHGPSFAPCSIECGIVATGLPSGSDLALAAPSQDEFLRSTDFFAHALRGAPQTRGVEWTRE